MIRNLGLQAGHPLSFRARATQLPPTLGLPLQGSSVFSDTASSNYAEWNVFELQVPRIPAKRLCRTEEVLPLCAQLGLCSVAG